jgi:hypothetical protein
LREAISEFQRTLVKGVEESHAKLCIHFGIISKRLITCESSALSKKKEASPISMLSKVKIDSDVSKYLATKAEQHNIPFESITSQETSVATEKHGKGKKPCRLDFLELKGLHIYLVITTSLMEIKPLQARKKGCLLAQYRLS